jgi:2,4-dienoyl-CoA reductase-like NADH-dependent reductase (Old Yellow Enzyme family)
MTDLRSPLRLRSGLRVPGRASLAPLTNLQSNDDGTLHDDELRWLLRRARGGFAWIATCAAYVCDEGKAWRGQLGVASAAHEPGLQRLAGALQAEGAACFVQLHHAGRLASLAPGPKLTTADAPEAGARGATADDLARVVDTFVAAALRAERAGFSGVELHGANGYLFTQFLAPADNPRDDAWGGDLAGRARLLRDTLRAVRAAVRPGFSVGVRISPVDTFARRGLLLADAVELVQGLAADGADFVHLSLRDACGPAPHEPPGPPVAQVIRAALPPEVALLAAGGLQTRADAERVMALGADVPVFGRAAIGNADLPRMLTGGPEAGAPLPPPWTREHLLAQDVSARFVAYLERFDRLVEGAAGR